LGLDPSCRVNQAMPGWTVGASLCRRPRQWPRTKSWPQNDMPQGAFRAVLAGLGVPKAVIDRVVKRDLPAL
jgi:hypothetical protein